MNKTNNKYTYIMPFSLTYPVNKVKEAKNYFAQHPMREALIGEINRTKEIGALGIKTTVYERAMMSVDAGKIFSFDWVLRNNLAGIIKLVTTAELTEKQLNAVSQYALSQNSTGLGRDFSQRRFAISFDSTAFRLDSEEYKGRNTSDGELPNDNSYTNLARIVTETTYFCMAG